MAHRVSALVWREEESTRQLQGSYLIQWFNDQSLFKQSDVKSVSRSYYLSCQLPSSNNIHQNVAKSLNSQSFQMPRHPERAPPLTAATRFSPPLIFLGPKVASPQSCHCIFILQILVLSVRDGPRFLIIWSSSYVSTSAWGRMGITSKMIGKTSKSGNRLEFRRRCVADTPSSARTATYHHFVMVFSLSRRSNGLNDCRQHCIDME